ncbi:hypothetical protein [Tsukamurella strandjordii]|uniref:Uncharacterized protein n=1 Tax=Tsukamurella strandjordii TaxID=147577 RepID=A0AA90SKC7_9ACTN|nr:hypothetical protein [Tsukamurella strandjordii]MDP0397133.1 hypothetical protein [Tsukamurella strandjordii]
MIRVDYTNYETTAHTLMGAAAKAEELIASLQANTAANLSDKNWLGSDQVSYKDVHDRCLVANQNIADVIRKASGKVQTAAAFHQAGQAQAATIYF